MNDNQNRGMPADIDVLLLAAEQVCSAHGTVSAESMDRRIENLAKIVIRVRPQYQEVAATPAHVCTGCGGKGWQGTCNNCVPY